MATFTSRFAFRLPDPTDLVTVTTDLNDSMSKIDANIGYQVVTAFPVAPVSGTAVTFSNDGWRSYFHNGTAPASGGWAELVNSKGIFGSNINLAVGKQLVIGADTNLYRSAASVLKTDDTFSAALGFIPLDQADPASPAAGSLIIYSRMGGPRWKSSDGDVYDGSASHRDDLMGGISGYETMSRISSWASLADVSGVLHLQPVWLPKGLVVSNLTWHNGGTAAVTPTNQWAALYDSSRVQLAITSNKTTTAIAANGKFTWAVATIASGPSTTFTTTYSGLYYVGLMIAATTMPTPIGAQTVGNANLNTPAFGQSDTAQTTPAAFPHTAIAPSAVGARYHYMVVS